MQPNYLNKGVLEPLTSTTRTKSLSKKIKFDISKVVKILNFQFPEWNKEGGKYKAKYRVRITYMDASGIKRDKSVFFGEVGRPDYVDHKNKDLRDIYVKRLGAPNSQFDPKFWLINLLNGQEDDLIKSYTVLRNSIL